MKTNLLRYLFLLFAVLGLSCPFYGQIPVYPSNLKQINGYCTGTATSSATLTLYPFGGPSGTSACTATTVTGRGLLMPAAGTILSINVRCGSAAVAASSDTFTVWTQPNTSGTAGATTMLVNFGATAANTTVSSTAAPVAFTANSLLSVRFTTAATDVIADCEVTIVYQ